MKYTMGDLRAHLNVLHHDESVRVRLYTKDAGARDLGLVKRRLGYVLEVGRSGLGAVASELVELSQHIAQDGALYAMHDAEEGSDQLFPITDGVVIRLGQGGRELLLSARSDDGDDERDEYEGDEYEGADLAATLTPRERVLVQLLRTEFAKSSGPCRYRLAKHLAQHGIGIFEECAAFLGVPEDFRLLSEHVFDQGIVVETAYIDGDMPYAVLSQLGNASRRIESLYTSMAECQAHMMGLRLAQRLHAEY